MEDTPEKQREYKEMAALACHLIDLLADIAVAGTEMTAQELREQIAFTKEQKDLLIADPKERAGQYAMACVFYSLPKGSG